MASALRGDFADAHLTRRQREGRRHGHAEEHRLRLRPAVRGGRDRGVRAPAGQALRGRLRVGDRREDHHRGVRLGPDPAWTAPTTGTRSPERSGGTGTTVVTIDGPSAWVVSGLTDLVVLKSTGSEFWGFPRDRYTSLAETNDRILATAVTARWRYQRHRRRLGQELRRRAPDLDGVVRGQAQPGAAADAVLHGRAGARGAPARWPRSACRCRTSTTSWST